MGGLEPRARDGRGGGIGSGAGMVGENSELRKGFPEGVASKVSLD